MAKQIHGEEAGGGRLVTPKDGRGGGDGRMDPQSSWGGIVGWRLTAQPPERCPRLSCHPVPERVSPRPCPFPCPPLCPGKCLPPQGSSCLAGAQDQPRWTPGHMGTATSTLRGGPTVATSPICFRLCQMGRGGRAGGRGRIAGMSGIHFFLFFSQ